MYDRAAALAAFQAKYNTQFSRETFTLDEPSADGTFVLKPDCDNPLPPVGCKVNVHDYRGGVYRTVVIDTDEQAGTYTAAFAFVDGAARSAVRYADDNEMW